MLGRAFYHGSQNELAVTFGSVHWVYALHRGHCLTQTHHACSTIISFIHEKSILCLKKLVNTPPPYFPKIYFL